MKKTTKKSTKVRAEKKAARKPRLTKEEREARKLKLQEERAEKKAARLAKREAKKQKEAEKKAAAKAKREEQKAKKVARLQKQKERKAAMKLKAKERAEAKKAREAVHAEKKAVREAKKAERKPRGKKLDAKAKKVALQEKIEAERNEWKALSAIRRYVKGNAKILEELDGDKLERKLKKLEKMGYEVLRGPDGKLLNVGYSFEVGVRIKVAKPTPEKKERKLRKPRAEKVEDAQPQDSVEAPIVPEELPADAEEKLLTDEEILEAAKQDNESAEAVEVLAGDTFKDETEIADDDSLKNSNEDEDNLDDNDGDEDENDDILGGGDGISSEQAEYRRDAFREMESNGAWD